MSNEPRAASLQDISKWICEGIATESEHVHPSESGALPLLASSDFHEERIEAALRRARAKTYVRVLKPLRRVWRNQGAVNDSLIEAVTHLAAQNQEVLEQLSDLRTVVRALQAERRPPARPPSEDSTAAAKDS